MTTPQLVKVTQHNVKQLVSNVTYDDHTNNIVFWFNPTGELEEVLGFTYDAWVEEFELPARVAEMTNIELYCYVLRKFK